MKKPTVLRETFHDHSQKFTNSIKVLRQPALMRGRRFTLIHVDCHRLALSLAEFKQTRRASKLAWSTTGVRP